VLLRGLPGSGKSRIARLLRQYLASQAAELGLSASRSVRVISIDDYFLQEDSYGEMEYVWEEEMLPTYRASVAKALKKVLDAPTTSADFHPIVVVDDTNLALSTLAAYAQAARSSCPPTKPSAAAPHYSANAAPTPLPSPPPPPALYVLELRGSPPLVCAARNVHGWSLEQLEELDKTYEPTPVDLPTIELDSLVAMLEPEQQKSAAGQPTDPAEHTEGGESEGGAAAVATSSAPAGPQAEGQKAAAEVEAADGGLVNGGGDGRVGGDGRAGGEGGALEEHAAYGSDEGERAEGERGTPGGNTSSSVPQAGVAPASSSAPLRSKWEEDEDEEDEDEEDEEGSELPKAPPAQGVVSGNVELLGGLMGRYMEKRVRWADLEEAKVAAKEAAKDAEFEKHAGFHIAGTAPLSRKRMRSPPPSERAEEAEE